MSLWTDFGSHTWKDNLFEYEVLSEITMPCLRLLDARVYALSFLRLCGFNDGEARDAVVGIAGCFHDIHNVSEPQWALLRYEAAIWMYCMLY